MKSNDILISVLMPVYNVENYIRYSIESILQQDYARWELIIVDDGSTDHSGEICDDYVLKDHRIKVFHQKNSGLLSARRRGIKEAVGEVVVFLDSDDFLEDGCFSNLIEIFHNDNPDIVMYSGYIFYSDNSKRSMGYSFKRGFVEKEDVYDKIIASDEFNAIWTKAIKRELLWNDPTDYKPFYKNSYGEDKLQFLYPITQARKVYYLNKELYNYRQTPNSLIHNLNVSMIEKKLHLEVWEQLFIYMKKWNKQDSKSLETVGLYFLRHMISTFSNTYYFIKEHAEKDKCLNYNWKEVIPAFIFKYKIIRKLSIKEKIKLYTMFMHNDSLLRILIKLKYRLRRL